MNLAGELVGFAGLRFLLGLHLFLQVFDDAAHLVDRVGALLDEVLHDAHALVVGLLQARDGILELLNLGLQLNHVLVDSECGGAAEDNGCEQGCGDEIGLWAVAGLWSVHGSSTLGFLSSGSAPRYSALRTELA